MAANATALAEEHKSDEMKALEAYLTAWKGGTWFSALVCASVGVFSWCCSLPLPPPLTAVDTQEVELTGQEDITLLYGTLATESAVNAHKDGECADEYMHVIIFTVLPHSSLLSPPTSSSPQVPSSPALP